MSIARSPNLSRAGALRVFLGLAVQPFVNALLAFIIFPIVDYTGRALCGGRPVDPFDAALSLALGVGIVGVVVTIFGALPALVWLRARRAVTRTRVLIGGAVLGNAPSALIVGGMLVSRLAHGEMPRDVFDLLYGPVGAIRTIAFGTFIGVASAAVFWGLAGRHIDVGSDRELSTGC
jgi:hypothetical protein